MLKLELAEGFLGGGSVATPAPGTAQGALTESGYATKKSAARQLVALTYLCSWTNRNLQVISKTPVPVIASGAKQSHKELAYANGPRDCLPEARYAVVGKNVLLATLAHARSAGVTEMHF